MQTERLQGALRGLRDHTWRPVALTAALLAPQAATPRPSYAEVFNRPPAQVAPAPTQETENPYAIIPLTIELTGGGRYYRHTNGGGPDQARNTRIEGYSVDAEMWPIFERLGGVEKFGYPVSDRFSETPEIDTQVFQHGVVQLHKDRDGKQTVVERDLYSWVRELKFPANQLRIVGFGAQESLDFMSTKEAEAIKALFREPQVAEKIVIPLGFVANEKHVVLVGERYSILLDRVPVDKTFQDGYIIGTVSTGESIRELLREVQYPASEPAPAQIIALSPKLNPRAARGGQATETAGANTEAVAEAARVEFRTITRVENNQGGWVEFKTTINNSMNVQVNSDVLRPLLNRFLRDRKVEVYFIDQQLDYPTIPLSRSFGDWIERDGKTVRFRLSAGVNWDGPAYGMPGIVLIAPFRGEIGDEKNYDSNQQLFTEPSRNLDANQIASSEILRLITWAAGVANPGIGAPTYILDLYDSHNPPINLSRRA